jgi:hypothetical protein
MILSAFPLSSPKPPLKPKILFIDAEAAAEQDPDVDAGEAACAESNRHLETHFSIRDLIKTYGLDIKGPRRYLRDMMLQAV